MARLDYLDPDDDVADEIRQRRGGTLRPLDQILLHSPPMAAGWNQLLGAVRNRSTLPEDIRELVILRVAALNRAAYEWDAHAPIAREAGLDEMQIEHLRSGSGPSTLSPGQQVAFDVATALTLDCRVGDEDFAAAQKTFGERGAVDLMVTVSAYNMVSRFLTALDVGEKLDLDDQWTGGS